MIDSTTHCECHISATGAHATGRGRRRYYLELTTTVVDSCALLAGCFGGDPRWNGGGIGSSPPAGAKRLPASAPARSDAISLLPTFWVRCPQDRCIGICTTIRLAPRPRRPRDRAEPSSNHSARSGSTPSPKRVGARQAASVLPCLVRSRSSPASNIRRVIWKQSSLRECAQPSIDIRDPRLGIWSPEPNAWRRRRASRLRTPARALSCRKVRQWPYRLSVGRRADPYCLLGLMPEIERCRTM